MKKIYPAKLKAGDKVAVIAPSLSCSVISAEKAANATKQMNALGLEVVFGQHVQETNSFNSSSIESRIHDLHWAFSDPSIKAVFAAAGGFNCSQLLQYIDWELIKNNPKIFSGYSDITALNNAIFSKTGLVTYSGPCYSTFEKIASSPYTLDYFKHCVMADNPITITPSDSFSGDAWFVKKEDRQVLKNEGFYSIHSGEARGTLVGANLVTLGTLRGTSYFPNLKDTILFLEDDYEAQPHHFDRDLQSLILQEGFDGVKGIVIGRFQTQSGITPELLQEIIASKKELAQLPIIANVDFGHTSPMISFPIGGEVSMKASAAGCEIVIEKH